MSGAPIIDSGPLETLTRQRDQWRNEAAFLISVIDYCAEADAPFDEIEAGDAASVALIRAALASERGSA